MSGIDYDRLPRAALVRLLRERDAALGAADGAGDPAAAWRIVRAVKPKLSAVLAEAGAGDAAGRGGNELWDGDNLSAMVSLYRRRGTVDLVLTDPPYNTGEDLRYRDRWDEERGDRHGAWLRFMTLRLQLMKAMLRPGGVAAVCIDHRELYRLGLLMDGIFGEENRLAIVNWQKSAAPRPDNRHVSTATEYVLVYARDAAKALTLPLGRSALDNRRYSNPDRDPGGDWREGNLTARAYAAKDDYGIQSPFTGAVHYPAGHGAWRHPKRNVAAWLAQWGADYEERDIGDGRRPALMVGGASPGAIPAAVAGRARARLAGPHWPFLWFGRDGGGRPRVKTYLAGIRRGKVPVTWWADADASVSWGYRELGRSSDGVGELNAIVGPGHGFATVKPLKLFARLVRLWCPPDGLVLDPFAGSGTTGHAVLGLNAETGSARRFILVEQGNAGRNDPYALTLTADRLRRALSGDWASGPRPPLPGGFRFIRLDQDKVDAEALAALAREEREEREER